MSTDEYEGIAVIGAGPAGSALAYLAKRYLNTNIVVYEALKRPGLKACGWGLLRSVERYIGTIPRGSILNNIKGFKIYVDNRLVVDYRSKRTIAYMVDRPRLMEEMLEHSNAEVLLGHRINIKEVLRINRNYLPVVATGFQWRPRDRKLILGIEYRVKNAHIDEPGLMEVWTWSGIVGYLWVFPFNNREVHIGIGGTPPYTVLRRLLDEFIKRDKRFKDTRIAERLSGYVTVNGLDKNFLDPNIPVIGEAMGAVLPLTGEGMRPSMISAWSLIKALNYGDWRKYTRIFDETGLTKSIKIQYKILKHVEKRRARLNVDKLKSLIKDCEWLAYELAFGKMDVWTILKALPCGLKKALTIASFIRRYGS